MSTVLIAAEPTVVELRPRFEGSNICTWIGFKHVMYLVEEAVLAHFRERGLVPRELFEEHGLCLEIVDSSVRILHALHMDDIARVEVRPRIAAEDPEMAFDVLLFVEREGKSLKALTGKVKVLFRQDRDAAPAILAPAEIAPFVVPEIRRTAPSPAASYSIPGRGADLPEDERLRKLLGAEPGAFIWQWHIPYFYCHFTERLQHSGYLRLMEEVVDRFLAARGISIRTLLETRRWIPVVPTARLEILSEALMEETIYVVYTVEEIFKDFTYTSRMDCYVPRGDGMLHTATGKITHGYAEILNRRDWQLVNFDEAVLAGLRGSR